MHQMCGYNSTFSLLGPLPHVNELVQNISLMLINSHRSLDAPRPGMPGLVSVGGIHIKPVTPLPAELQVPLTSYSLPQLTL